MIELEGNKSIEGNLHKNQIIYTATKDEEHNYKDHRIIPEKVVHKIEGANSELNLTREEAKFRRFFEKYKGWAFTVWSFVDKFTEDKELDDRLFDDKIFDDLDHYEKILYNMVAEFKIQGTYAKGYYYYYL